MSSILLGSSVPGVGAQSPTKGVTKRAGAFYCMTNQRDRYHKPISGGRTSRTGLCRRSFGLGYRDTGTDLIGECGSLGDFYSCGSRGSADRGRRDLSRGRDSGFTTTTPVLSLESGVGSCRRRVSDDSREAPIVCSSLRQDSYGCTGECPNYTEGSLERRW